MYNHGMTMAVWDLKTTDKPFTTEAVFDCMIAESFLSYGKYMPEQEIALKKYHVSTLDEMAQKQQELLASLPRMQTLVQTIEFPLIYVLRAMEQRGIQLDVECLRSVGKNIDIAILTTEQEIQKEIPGEVNLHSSVQLGNFLAEKIGVPLSKTKTGRYATNEQELSKYSASFPLIQHLLQFRELTKLRSTYVESLIEKVDSDGRIHTTYNQVAVSTGRLSSANPNLQNIPVTSDFGQKIKSCFVATEGNILLSFDYSQQELRILAHLAGEEQLITAFRNGRDVHTTTAGLLFGVPYDEVKKDQRMIAKTINFGIIYGMSSFGMSAQLNIPVEQAQQFIDTFYKTYPKIKSFYEGYLKQARIDGYVETILGRRRYVFEYPGQKFIDNSMRRVLINYPIQGSAADLMKKAMVEIYDQVVKNDPEVHLLLQIHDDLVFEVPDDELKVAGIITTIKHMMCNVFPLSVPVEVEVKKGKNWGEMNSIS